MRLIAIVLLALSVGCVATVDIGPGGRYAKISAALAGANYRHSDLAETEDGSEVTWDTNIISTWGHAQIDADINATSEKVGVERKGASDNITKIIGEDFGKNLTDKALCAFVPTACLGGIFQGDEKQAGENRAEAIQLASEAGEKAARE